MIEKIKMIKSILIEYGPIWVVNRFLYSSKLKMMSVLPFTEKFFEKDVRVKRVDLFNFNIASIKTFLSSLSEDKKFEIIETADKAISGVIKCFSSVELDYGRPINWHYNPLSEVKCSKHTKWYKIPDFDSKRGDIKVIWEASRFTQFFYFIRAYLLTNDKKYYNAFSEQLAQWLSDNPYSFGANYKCGQENSLRLINTLIAYNAFKNAGILIENDEENVKKLVEVCYKKILSNFFYAHKCIKNNHTLSEISGLAIGAWCCINEAKVSNAFKLFDKEIRNQFLSDGGYRQYSFNYQRFALQIFECICKIGEKTGYYLKEIDRIKNSVLMMYQVQINNGDMPNYGSNDGALIFPVTVCDFRDYRPTLNSVYAIITGKKLYEKGEYDEEYLWFGNGEAEVIDNCYRKSLAFQYSGLYTLRDNDSLLLVCLQNFNSRPAHMDQFHIDLWHKGVNILCDSGTYSYASELGEKLSLTSAHNTVKLHDTDQMNKHGAFLIYDWTKCKNVLYDTNRFSAIMVSANGYEHKREISVTGSGYIISDEVKGSGDYCEFLFHTPCEAVLIPSGFELSDGGRKLCRITSDVLEITINKEYRSLYYMKREEISCISVKCSLEGNRCAARFLIELAG